MKKVLILLTKSTVEELAPVLNSFPPEDFSVQVLSSSEDGNHMVSRFLQGSVSTETKTSLNLSSSRNPLNFQDIIQEIFASDLVVSL